MLTNRKYTTFCAVLTGTGFSIRAEKESHLLGFHVPETFGIRHLSDKVVVVLWEAVETEAEELTNEEEAEAEAEAEG